MMALLSLIVWSEFFLSASRVGSADGIAQSGHLDNFSQSGRVCRQSNDGIAQSGHLDKF